MNYYNEFDRGAAAWLRELITAGEIPAGDVDERSICNVRATELTGYRQCHFLAGIGGWAYALKLAGWPEDRPVWTGSCPCQPFSAAGKRMGTKDSRHLWPAFRRLIARGNPAIVFGEQVASADGRLWLAGVRSNLERLGYAVGAADLCAAGGAEDCKIGLVRGDNLQWVDAHLGAPHIRQRLYWVADLSRERFDGRQTAAGAHGRGEFEASGAVGRMGDATSNGRQQSAQDFQRGQSESLQPGRSAWSDFDVIPCTDGKARRIESGSFPLAHGIPGRVGLLRGYGNAIVPQVAAQFIGAYLDLE